MIDIRYVKRAKLFKYIALLVMFLFVNSQLDSSPRFNNTQLISSCLRASLPTTDTINCYLQKDTSAIFYTAEQMPEFPGGIDSLYKFIGKNISYPAESITQQKQGTVIVSFFIDVDGRVKKPHILKGVDSLLNKEAIRVVSILPKWTAGKQEGKRVRVAYNIPIIFKLSNKICVNPDKVAEFPGGKRMMIRFIVSNIKYPIAAIEYGMEGNITVVFTVDVNGNIDNVHCLPHEYGMLENEAIRIVQSMPRWKAAVKNGKNVNSVVKVPICFSLHR